MGTLARWTLAAPRPPIESPPLWQVATVKPHLVQSWMDPLQQARPLRRVCREHGIQFQAYSSLGTQHHVGINPVLRHPVLNALAQEIGKSVAQAADPRAAPPGKQPRSHPAPRHVPLPRRDATRARRAGGRRR